MWLRHKRNRSMNVNTTKFWRRVRRPTGRSNLCTRHFKLCGLDLPEATSIPTGSL